MCVVMEKVKIFEGIEFYLWFYSIGSRMVFCFDGELIYFIFMEFFYYVVYKLNFLF